MRTLYIIKKLTSKEKITIPLLLILCILLGATQTTHSQNVELAFVVPPITNTQDATPSFVFNSTVAGSLSLGGGLTTPTTRAEVGYNYITLNKTANGTYNGCYIMVTATDGRTGRLDIGNLTVNAPEDKHLWNSIRTAGFDYDDIAITTKTSAEWLARHHDMIVLENNIQKETAYDYMKSINPQVKLFGNISMHTSVSEWMDNWCIERGIDPEELYFHYMEDTQLQTPDGWTTMLGYGPNGTARTLKEARVRTYYTAPYPPFCPTSKIFCEAFRDYTLACMIINNEQGKYLDGLIMNDFINNIWEARDIKLENTIEMRGLGNNTSELARQRVANDMIKMKNQIEQYIEATIGKEFSISGNISEADHISTYSYFTKNHFNHLYNELTVGPIADMKRMQIYDISSLVEVYETMEKGVTILTGSQTNTYDKPAQYTDESWASFIQFTLAVPLLVAHDNGYFSFHRGDASYYGGWPQKGDLTTSHWHVNWEYDLGKPVSRSERDYWGRSSTNRFYIFAGNANDVNLQGSLKYMVLARNFEKGIVLANYGHDDIAVSMGSNPVTIDLGDKYRRLLEDNSLGEEITQITLGKGHGAILLKSSSEEPPITSEEPPITSEEPKGEDADSDNDNGSDDNSEEPNDNDEEADTDVFIIDKSKYNIVPTRANARATTDSINKAIEDAKALGYKKIRLEKGEYWISSDKNIRWGRPRDGIFVPSNTEFDLNGATLRLEPNNKVVYGLIQLHAVENITIKNGHLIGDRNQHSYVNDPEGPTHEWGFGVHILASDNITVENMIIEQMTGDAIILTNSAQGQAEGQPKRYCQNVIIQNNDLFECRRQGISVVHAKDVYIYNNKIHHIGRYNTPGSTNPVDGTDPGSGIDVEPGPFEVSGLIATNVRIHENHIHHCVQGISFHTGNDNEAVGNLIEDTRWEGIGVSGSQRIKIYNNTFNRSYIHANERLAIDVCAPETGEYRNILKEKAHIYNGATMTGNFPCPE